jgi:hypothetical protein
LSPLTYVRILVGKFILFSLYKRRKNEEEALYAALDCIGKTTFPPKIRDEIKTADAHLSTPSML